MIAVVGDHGEGLGDHGWWTHGNLYQEQLRVPLILAGPGVAGDRTVEDPVRTIDLAPTLLELAGIAFESDQLDGRSLLPAPAGQISEPTGPVYAEVRGEATYHPEWVRHREVDRRGESFAVVEDGWKLIHRTTEGRFELYDLENDPKELVDRASEENERVGRLARRLRDLGAYRELPDADEVPPRIKRQLESLGYGGE